MNRSAALACILFTAAAAAAGCDCCKPEADIDELKGGLWRQDRQWFLRIQYEVERERLAPDDQTELVLRVMQHGRRLVRADGRPIEYRMGITDAGIPGIISARTTETRVTDAGGTEARIMLESPPPADLPPPPAGADETRVTLETTSTAAENAPVGRAEIERDEASYEGVLTVNLPDGSFDPEGELHLDGILFLNGAKADRKCKRVKRIASGTPDLCSGHE